VSGKLPAQRLVHVKASEAVILARPLNAPLLQHPRESRKRQRKRREGGFALSRKPNNKSPSPESFHRICVTNVDNPDITDVIVQITDIRFRPLEQLSVFKTSNRVFKEGQIKLTLWVTPLSQNHFLTSPCNFESRDEILLKGGRL
jgi:hypothetical protein